MEKDTDSPRYFAKHWRNIPQEKLDALEEFMAWYETDYVDNHEDQLLIPVAVTEMRHIIDEFLELNPIKAKLGEEQLLERWIKANE